MLYIFMRKRIIIRYEYKLNINDMPLQPLHIIQELKLSFFSININVFLTARKAYFNFMIP